MRMDIAMVVHKKKKPIINLKVAIKDLCFSLLDF